MGLRKKWKTTNRADGPTGRKYKGTLRDVSFVGGDPDAIDFVDHMCMQEEKTRSEILPTLHYAYRVRVGEITHEEAEKLGFPDPRYRTEIDKFLEDEKKRIEKMVAYSIHNDCKAPTLCTKI